MNIRRTMYRLQTALCMRGTKIKINQRQSWSDKAGRMVTKYVVYKETTDKKTDKPRYALICESWQAADVVVMLAGLLADGDGGGG